MVIVASVALATMVSNDLVMPALWRTGLLRADRHNPVGDLLLWVRRASIIVLAAAAYAYYRVTSDTGNLAAFGLLAFAAVAQFAPALLGGLYWRGASRQGVYAGLSAGFAIWVYTLLLPTLTRAGWLGSEWLYVGPLGLSWLRPEQLFGLSGWDAITHGTFWSLLFNVGAFMVVSARYRPSFEDRIRATPFLDPYASRPIADDGWRGNVRTADLLASLPCRVFAVQVDTRHLPEYVASDPDLYRLAFWRLLEEIDAHLEREHQPGMLMVDMRSDMHSSVQDRRLIDAYREWISSRMGRTRLVELPWFGFSAFYAGLQLADFAAYLMDFTSNELERDTRDRPLYEISARIRDRVSLIRIP
ncbi:MAG: hypothetical protein CVV17_04555 [Gammaproteobacteria bacterium HGW-Gammaproteobacteria-7]|nr:MAG: hypothetical protein CVV17_04555 [Gammaproteobacteria bacterium HGW-Gammaproteobacteria-7]